MALQGKDMKTLQISQEFYNGIDPLRSNGMPVGKLKTRALVDEKTTIKKVSDSGSSYPFLASSLEEASIHISRSSLVNLHAGLPEELEKPIKLHIKYFRNAAQKYTTQKE